MIYYKHHIHINYDIIAYTTNLLETAETYTRPVARNIFLVRRNYMISYLIWVLHEVSMPEAERIAP